jgi:hypothetical protein
MRKSPNYLEDIPVLMVFFSIIKAIRGVKLLATVNNATGQIVWQEDESYTAEPF